MSKLETSMTRRYWQRVGGTLIEDYLIVPPATGVAPRKLDAVIILDGECRIALSPAERSVSLGGRDVIIVQIKKTLLGDYCLGTHLLGQAYYSRKLVLRRFAAKSVRSIVLCSKDDNILRELPEEDGIEIIVNDGFATNSQAMRSEPYLTFSSRPRACVTAPDAD